MCLGGPLLAAKNGLGGTTFGCQNWSGVGPLLAAKSGLGGPLLATKSGLRGPVLVAKSGPPRPLWGGGDHFWHDMS